MQNVIIDQNDLTNVTSPAIEIPPIPSANSIEDGKTR
jgi:hypothetical protein